MVTIYVTGRQFADGVYIRFIETASLGIAICATGRADQVLYSSYTLGIYIDDIVLCVFMQHSHSWWRREIEEFSTVQWTYQALCAAVSTLVIQVNKQD